MASTGIVFWVTGYSGSGKTTVGHLLVERLRLESRSVIFLDGDAMRTILAPMTTTWGSDLAYAREARTKLGLVYGRLAAELSRQGFDVVCSTISMFGEVFRWNRSHIENYREIYLKVPIEVLRQRDQKGLYSQGKHGSSTSVAGVDFPIDEPIDADLVIQNYGTVSPAVALAQIWNSVGPSVAAPSNDH